MVNFLQCDLDQYRETYAKFSDILKTIKYNVWKLGNNIKKVTFRYGDNPYLTNA